SLGADIDLKVDYFRLSDSNFRHTADGDGVYVGLSMYKQLFVPNLYFGMEAGWAGASGTVTNRGGFSFDNDVNYVLVEFNTKYVIPISRCFNFDFGAGISANYLDVTVNSYGRSWDDSKWLFGGQFFAEANYKIKNFFTGIDVKYQLTEDTHLFGETLLFGNHPYSGTSADNLRVGAHAGFYF
ncbi:MAG: hypothetical protein ABSH41_26155, partial [Syntrophobacteraceae bacterium]